MTREEKLQQFAEQTTKGLYLDRHNLIQMVKQGAKWADQHPHWIPVKEDRPKVSGDYIICEKRGFVREAHYFELDDLWMLHGGVLVSPTHWMPMPPAPRKEE